MTYLKKYSGPEPKPMTEEQKKEEVEVLETLMERYRTRPEPPPKKWLCLLCASELDNRDELIFHYNKWHTQSELAIHIAYEEDRHDD